MRDFWKMGKLQRYIGDKKFYKMVLAVALPIMIQNGITNLVGMLDNIMVGQVGTVQMNGVAIVNQLLFVFNLCIFGAASGAGIFTAQFSGSSDHEGVRHTFRFKILVCLLLSAVGIGLLLSMGPQLIQLYLKGEGSAVDAADSLRFGHEYLLVMLWGLVPFALANAYASTLRETGQTVVPMVAGVGAVLVNLFFNDILIFGHFGAPAMGVKGAAIATVISRFVELGILVAWTHGNPRKNPFIVGAYRSMRIPGHLTGAIIRKGLPLMLNEFLWSLGLTVLSQCYSTRGLHVIGAMNITNTLWNVFSVSFLAMGNAVGIIMGRMLGAGDTEEEVRGANRKLSAFSVAVSVVFAVLYGLAGQVFPNIYNTTDQVRELARMLITVGVLIQPLSAYNNATYFTLRSGGQVLITMLFDSCFVWVVNVPLAFCLTHFTNMDIVAVYFCCQATEVVKCFLGAWMIKRGAWIRNIVVQEKA